MTPAFARYECVEMNAKTPNRFQKMIENKEIHPRNDPLRSIPLHQAVQMAQKAVQKYIPAGKSLVDDLIQARRPDN
jgi:hypothetical protein